MAQSNVTAISSRMKKAAQSRSGAARFARTYAPADPETRRATNQVEDYFAAQGMTELQVRYSPDEKIVWACQQHTALPCVNPPLLRDIKTFQRTLVEFVTSHAEDEVQPIENMVWASDSSGVFNLGGDLRLFAELVENQDRDSLIAYASDCIDVIHPTSQAYGLPILVIALVQGDALGGGFESILPFDVIVAEQSAKFGLPEILFGLFPGMGAYSYLSRRIGAIEAERMIQSGKIYSATELHEMGIVDVVAEDGFGGEAVSEYLQQNHRRHSVKRALRQVRRKVNPVTRDELMDIAELWVDTALAMSDSDVSRMVRLHDTQLRRQSP